MDERYRYVTGERLPVEVLVFQVAPERVDEFLAVDHEVWTLGEASTGGAGPIPFLSKEVWLDDAHPGRITIVFVWESAAAWEQVADVDVQRALQERFEASFPYPVELVRAYHEESDHGIHRVSRFERIDPPN